MPHSIVTSNYDNAVKAIKAAILKSQYKAAKLVNRELLILYFAIGRYISLHSRDGFWGTGAIDIISQKLQNELPGLRGFSARNLKNMRTFYEEWSFLEGNPAVLTAELSSDERQEIPVRQLQLPNWKDFPVEAFFQIGFTHHCLILTKVKSLEERLFYIRLAAANYLRVERLKRDMENDVYRHQGALPNNFSQALSSGELAKRAILAFKDEYLLDFINVEDLGARDIEDVDERVLENTIIQNVKNFIMAFGHDFSFIGNQYRIDVLGHVHIIDLLFFNRELASLVAVELKTGPFKPIYLGQLNVYLQALDDFVRKPHENPSIGLVLCKSADKAYVEYAVRDYNKPMGVASYRTADEMPERLKKALPDIEDLRKQLSQSAATE